MLLDASLWQNAGHARACLLAMSATKTTTKDVPLLAVIKQAIRQVERIGIVDLSSAVGG